MADQEPERLYRFAGQWLCRGCYDRMTEGSAFGGGMPTVNYLLPSLSRLLRRRRSVRQETATCDVCGQTGLREVPA